MIEWLNQNSGFVSVLIFVATFFLGWFTGIFKALMRKPNFRVELLPGPTFSSTFLSGKKYKDYDVHKTAISLYLKIINIGNAPAAIEKIFIGFHWNLNKFNFLWVRYSTTATYKLLDKMIFI